MKGIHLGRKFTQEHKDKISKAMKGVARVGKKHSNEWKRKISNSMSGVNKGRKFTPEHKKKISLSMQGEKSPNWKGGITPKNALLRASTEMKVWRKSAYERDGYRCVLCGQIGGELNAHHIKSFSKYEELRLDINNGITLCKKCHKLEHKVSHLQVTTKCEGVI